MAGPLSPLSLNLMNARTPETAPRTCKSAASFVTAPSATKPAFDDDEITWDDDKNNSSPFQSEVDENKPPADDHFDFETPSRRRSPQKMAATLHTSSPRATPSRSSPSRPVPASVRGMRSSPMLDATPRPVQPMTSPRTTETVRRSPFDAVSSRPEQSTIGEQTLRDNEGLTAAVNMMEPGGDSSSRSATEPSELGETTSFSIHEDANIDDTCFSTFSEIPNVDMTMFAKLGQRSPTKTLEFMTPRAGGARTPGTSRRPDDNMRPSSPTPRRTNRTPAKEGDTTNLLIDFTQQFESFSLSTQASPSKRNAASPIKMNTEPDLRSYINNQRSPGKPQRPAANTPMSSRKNILNLLDFELPPAPTPRSIPSITVRELESLKSQHLSELSSLKATLSGREAEVESLKRAVGDAERRAGEAAETVREEKNSREHAEKERAEWERRGREFEDVLRKIREEVIAGEKEKEELSAKLEEAERRSEEAEAARSDAEAKAAEAMSKVFSTSAAGRGEGGTAAAEGLFTAEQVQKQIDEKVHTLSTELHAIYKKKHVTKVAGLKKGFEAKTKERTAELERKVEELAGQVEELQAARDATLSGVHVIPSSSGELGALQEERKRAEEQRAELEEQKARMAGLAEEVRSVKAQHAGLLKELEAERVEKGELVAAVDEMLALQADVGAPAAVEDFRKSISRPSGLRGPGFGAAAGESRIGRAPGLNRSTSSSLASSIARMGAVGR